MQVAQHSAYALDQAASMRVQRLAASPAAWPSAAEDALRKRLLRALEQQPWWNAEASNALIIDGTAILQGVLGNRSDRVAARVVAMAIPGVQAVRDDRVRAQQWQSMA